VLVVAADSMSSILMASGEEDPRAKTVGSAIFGDGCAAAVLSGDRTRPGPVIVATHVHQIAGTLDAVKLVADSEDSYLHLDRELPDLASAGLGDLVSAFLSENGLAAGAVDHWIVHPGGRRILQCARDALGLDDDDVAISWRALAEYGNVGTPSIFYVMRRTLDERSPERGERGLVVTIGPGVTLGLMLLEF
jgi:alkylresorcinol/alkylpyrone synthase